MTKAEEVYKQEKQVWIETETERQKDMALHVAQLKKEVEYFEYQANCNKQRLKHATHCLDKAKVGLEKYIKG
jgi:hypothetical protein